MKAKNRFTAMKKVLLLLLTLGVLLICVACNGNQQKIVIEGDFADGTVLEYTGKAVQFPVAHIEDGNGKILSYNVQYKVVNLSDNSELTDEYALFDLKTGKYQLIYTHADDTKVSKRVSFEIKDTLGPVIEFMDIPNGLFLQDITEDTVNKLPLYSMEDASTAEGIELARVLKFKGEGDPDFKEYPFREINNSYAIDAFGTFQYILTAKDAYGNETVATAQWKVKDRDWKPQELPGDGILADYSSEGYCNLVEGGDANQYYKIGNDYTDEWLPEFQGAQGVLKMELSFNNSVGWGNNTIRLRLPKTFTQKDLAGKYLAVRIYVEGEHIKPEFLFAGNNVQFWAEDATTRAFSTSVSGLETGKWMTFYVDAATVEHIGMYPNATYNPGTTFYEGGDPADALQLCFHRETGYYNNMTLYVDSVSIAEFLPDTQISISGNEAFWTAVPGATGYLVNINGEESTIQETRIALPGEKGYIRVTPLGNGATTLNAQTVTAVYGLDAGSSLAKFDDKLYIDLFTDILRFSNEAEHSGYRPKSLTGTLTENGLKMDIGTGSWGVVTGVRFLFPKAQEKGSNTTLILNMLVSNNDYGNSIRVYDYDGKPMGTLTLSDSTVGKFYEYELDISAYKGTLKGIQLIFGPNSSFTSVAGGVSVTFQDIYLKNTYYPITVDGQSMMCAGSRELIPGYTTGNVVQFTTFYNFGVRYDDAPLGFSGTVLLDGKKQQDVTVVGYPNTDTICFKLPHNGKILTIMKDSVIYSGGIAVKVENTFNAKWNGSSWTVLANIPAEPETEYVTLADGSVKTVENKVALQPGYTASGVVQFLDVYNFGVPADDTTLGFEGTVMLDGELVHNPLWVGYPNNTTIALKAPHQGQLLTVMKDSVLYYGDSAVIVQETFNAKWNGSSWHAVSEVPAIPETKYVTLSDGITRELVSTVTLTPGYTMDSLVQFTNVYDFGAPADSTPIGFEGTVLLQGKEVTSPAFNSYLNSTTIGLEKLNHAGKVVTILAGSYIYNDTHAIQVKTTFNAVWDGTKWTDAAEIPTPEQPQEGSLRFEYRYGTANIIQVNTNLPVSTPIANFLVTDNGCHIDQSGNLYQQVGWIGMANAEGTIVLTFNFNGNFSAGQTYFLPKGAVFGFTDGSKYTLDKDHTFTFDGSGWTTEEAPVDKEAPITFAVMSDIHMGDTDTSEKFQNAMAYFSGMSVKPEAYLFVGDLTNSVGGTGSASQIQSFKAIYEAYASPEEMLYCLGPTHDVPANTDTSATVQLFANTFGTAYFANDLQSAAGLRHIQKNGFHFISIEWDSANGGTLTAERKAWLKAQLDAAVAEDGSKPIFVITHVPDEPSVDAVLSNYPQVICFTGHTHNSIAREDSISQDKGFTQIHCGGMNYYRVDGYNRFTSDPYLNLGDVYDFAQALYVQVSADNTVTVTRKDVRNQTDIGQQWVIKPGQTAYTADRENTAKGCAFSENAVLDIEEIGNSWLKVSWDGAKMGEAGPAIYYQVQLLAPNGDGNYRVVDHKELSSQQVFYPNDQGIPSLHYSYLFKNCLNSLDDYAIVVTAQDCWKQSQNVLTYTNGTFTSSLPTGGMVNVHSRDMTQEELGQSQKVLSFHGVHYGIANQFLIETNLTEAANCSNFLATDNGNDIKQEGSKQVGYFAMHNFTAIDGKKLITPVFNSDFVKGEYYVLKAGSRFVLGDGTYVLDKDYTFTYDGSGWTMTSYKTLSFAGVHYGIANQFLIETNLTEEANCDNFLASDNGNDIKQSGSKKVGYFAMHNFTAIDGKKLVTPVFNSDFVKDEYYVLEKGSIFVFGDGSYVLDSDYTFTYDGASWTMTTSKPSEPEQPEPPEQPEEPEKNVLTFQYRYGAAKLIQVNTNLPVTTPCVNFLTSDNGCSIDQSGNQYQQIGWVGMEKVGSTIVLTFQFNNSFSAGQTFTLPAGAVFGFTDGSKYTLDLDYTFVFSGSSWTMETAEPTEPQPPEQPEQPIENTLTFLYRYGAAKLIQVNTNLPVTTPCVNFLTTDNGCSIDQSGNQYQQIGWVGMEKVGSTIVLTFQFNNSFTSGQTFTLPAGAVFGFTDGSRFKLDKNYTFTFNGTSWTMVAD